VAASFANATVEILTDENKSGEKDVFLSFLYLALAFLAFAFAVALAFVVAFAFAVLDFLA
jgi:hypothetical protein